MASSPAFIDQTLFNSTTRAISSSTTKAGAVGWTHKEITIRYIGTTYTALSGSPALDLRVETVSGGLPTGTLWATNTNAVYSPGATNTFAWTQLTADATIAAGSQFALVVGYSSGTSATVVQSTGIANGNALVYPVTMASGTWSAPSNSLYPAIAAKLSDGTILRGFMPIQQAVNNTYQVGTSPNERAAVITLYSTMRMWGVRMFTAFQSASTAAAINVYAGTSTTPVAGSGIVIPAGQMNTTGTSLVGPLVFDSPLTLAPGEYRIGLKSTAAFNLVLYKLTFLGSAERDACIGEIREDTRDGGDWLGETSTSSPMIWPLFDDVTSGGGGLINGGLITTA